MAGDPAGALLLLGMGVHALSMSPASLPRAKLVIRSFRLQRARALLDAALGMEDGFAIHRLLNGAQSARFLGGSHQRLAPPRVKCIEPHLRKEVFQG
jgi:phosphotransferase system, enzyme I, PtsP